MQILKAAKHNLYVVANTTDQIQSLWRIGSEKKKGQEMQDLHEEEGGLRWRKATFRLSSDDDNLSTVKVKKKERKHED